jgi:hypothetical protein
MINVEKSTIIGRIESPANPECINPVDYLFDQVLNGSDSESDYTEALEGLLLNGMIAKNLCCPTCDVLNNDTGLQDKVYAFGKDIFTPVPASPYNGSPVCCTDSYGTTSGCSATFDADWDAFILTLVGQNTAALTALVPGQVNEYAGAGLNLIIAKIQSITSSIPIQYGLMEVLLNRGFQVACINGGDKIISAIPY